MEFIGEIGEGDKGRLLAEAASLFAIPEIIQENQSGFVVETIKEAVAVVCRIAKLEAPRDASPFNGWRTIMSTSIRRLLSAALDLCRRNVERKA